LDDTNHHIIQTHKLHVNQLMRGFNDYFRDHLKDELDSINGLGTYSLDVNRKIHLSELRLPATKNEYTMREILETEAKLISGELVEEVEINESKMIVVGELIYLAAIRLRREQIYYKIVFSVANNPSGFSVINQLN
jgi:hypothetical protein